MIEDNKVYPSNTDDVGRLGRVYASFVLEKDGSIGRVQIFKGINPDLDNIALEAIKKIKVLKPAKKNGEAVSMAYTLPIFL